MSGLYDIIDVLEQLIREHERMLKLAKQKKEVLIAGAIADLARIIQFESRSIKNIQALELERERHVSLYFMLRGVRKETVYLSDLIEAAGDSEAGRALHRCQQRLNNLLKELKNLNELNQQLIQQSLAYVNLTLEEMTTPVEDHYTYRKPVEPQFTNRSGGQRFFDSKA
ncbi:flagellar protein FlgN [Aneurinibacillus sp. Ricciae_BoGa-3]|uniref:flagellar protein FlgN n=1 Tax=Aneurinibacillus sp. Ricciae_BoGa-3 TaxID=3022697 RepID=UPI002341F6F8|nr:flagellar protein FlgN [Aneurinibacillus sp. Ricciae_BoGa-3]WCK54200.1 flagellar protein FlgN [Aneurinibacillus sp. Ricciae_BoGa-3]